MDTGDKYINMERQRDRDRERDIRQLYHKQGRQRDLTGREASLKLIECHHQQTGISSCAHNVTPSATIRKAIQRESKTSVPSWGKNILVRGHRKC